MNTANGFRFLSGALVTLIFTASVQVFAKTIDWKEDAKLHDGRTIVVNLQTSDRFYNASISILAPFNFQSTGFNTFRTEFRHPETGERIVWEGLPGFYPLLIDVIDGKAYVVLSGRPNKETSAIYGCPELPYVYLRYGVTGWTPIPVEQAPAELRKPNISVFDVWTGFEGRSFDADEVAQMLKDRELRGDGRIQDSIPRSYDEWKTQYKDGERNDRKFGDCRPPPLGRQDVKLPTPLDVELQLVESVDVDDSEIATSAIRLKPRAQSRSNCKSAFRIADLTNRMMGERFTQDTSGSKVVPYAGPSPVRGDTMLDFRTSAYCDDENIWFVAAKEEVGKIHISKYTRTGDLLYNVRFTYLEALGPKLGSEMVIGTVEVEGENLVFYWWQGLPRTQFPNQSQRYPARLSKFSFKEPRTTALHE